MLSKKEKEQLKIGLEKINFEEQHDISEAIKSFASDFLKQCKEHFCDIDVEYKETEIRVLVIIPDGQIDMLIKK